MLIKHLRDVNRRPFATVVAVGKGKVGVAICNPKDEFDKKIGVVKAEGRARGDRGPLGVDKKGADGQVPNRRVYHGWMFDGIQLVPATRQSLLIEVVEHEIDHMLKRSEKYYQ